MRVIIFDSGPIISLAVNNMLWVLDKLKEDFGGEFYIPLSVRKELIDRPIESKKFKFEALQVLNYIRKGTLKVHTETPELTKLTNSLLALVNTCYTCSKENFKMIHYAEMEAVALAIKLKAEAMVVDERMMRSVVEEPMMVEKIMFGRLHRTMKFDKVKLRKFKEKTKNIKLIRSIELAVVAYEKGWLNDFLPKKKEVKRPGKFLLQAVLWALKLRGASITQREIDKIVKLETSSIS